MSHGCFKRYMFNIALSVDVLILLYVLGLLAVKDFIRGIIKFCEGKLYILKDFSK